MKKVIQFLLITLVMSSCVSMKERIYIQDYKGSSTVQYPVPNNEYKVSMQDILYVTVKTIEDA